MKKFVPFVFLFLTFSSSLTFGQIEDRFSYLLEEDVKEYAQPLATAAGVAFNSGTFYTAKVPRLFGFSLSVRGMLVMVPDDDLTFKPNLPEGYSSEKETATIFGDKGAAYTGADGYLVYPPGINESNLPMVFPQASVSFMGSEVMLRYLPKIDIGETDLSLFGFGLKHSISQYIPLSPVDLAVQFLYNSFTMTDVVDVTNTAFNVQVSKSFGLFTAYGGLQYESTSFDLEYTYVNHNSSDIFNEFDGETIKVNLDGENNFRATIGGSAKFVFLVLNAGYSIGKHSVLSSGLTLEF